VNLFVPGRICLFGEHTDWAGGYRRINAPLEKGHALITGTNQGLYAEVEPHPSKLILSSALEDVCIVVQRNDLELFQEFFATPPPIENWNKLSRENQQYNDYLMSLGRRITFIAQDVQEGFGHAVYCTRDWGGR